ncbi:MAG: hypothetical protein CSA68_06635 [Rhodobacterales bacterium]|nr:MAG: hypothetical protein CSA68_06635 [Rhodobacterales bacterium]
MHSVIKLPFSYIPKDLKAAGSRSCVPTNVYAWMRAAGLVNDHLVSCDFRLI